MTTPNEEVRRRLFDEIFGSVDTHACTFEWHGKADGAPPPVMYESELHLRATVALNARAENDPRWATLLYRMQCWSVQHTGKTISDDELAEKLSCIV